MRPRRRHRPAEQEAADRRAIDLPAHQAAPEQRLHLGGEHQQPARRIVPVVQRLDTEPIAAEEQAAVRVVEREGEHAVQPLEQPLDAPLLVPVDDRLGVGSGSEQMAERAELGPQQAVVVDLAVVGHPDRAVLVRQRLPPGARHVDDRQPPVAEDDLAPLVQPLVVGPAMELRGHHPQHRRPIAGRRAPLPDHAGDAAHVTSRSGG